MTEMAITLVRNMDDAERAAKAMSASGFFADTKQASQAIVKIMAGQELGFGPFASMTGVNIIQNKPVLAANLMAAAVKRTNKYNYRVLESTDKICTIEWIEAGQPIGKSSFTLDEAARAGLTTKDNWKKYPSDMLFARAISRGQKRYAPDIFNGATVYTPDELGAVVDDEGNVIDTQTTEGQADPEIVDDKLWDHWEVMTKRAYAVQVPFPEIERSVIKASRLKEMGTELRANVEQAEAQAKAG